MRTISRTVTGEEHAEIVAGRLIRASCYFSMEPLPDDVREFIVKEEREEWLDDCIKDTIQTTLPSSEDSPPSTSFLLNDGCDSDLQIKPVRVTVKPEENGYGLMIGIQGHGLHDMEPGYEEVVVIEHWQGDVRVLVWSDITKEDPTVISMANARESNLPPDKEELKRLWSDEDEQEAITQGWILFNGLGYPTTWSIERCVDQLSDWGDDNLNYHHSQTFPSHEAAKNFVAAQADSRDPLAWRAIEFLRTVKSKDAERFKCLDKMWCLQDQQEAQAQGWDIFHTGRPAGEVDNDVVNGKPYGYRPFEIQRCDEADIFKGGDLEAHAFVRKNYEAGELLTQRAAEFLKLRSPVEYEAVFGERTT